MGKRSSGSDGVSSARAYVLRLLARRDYSTHAIKQKLKERGLPDVTSELADFLDDERYAETLVRGALRRHKGYYWILQRLKRDGLPAPVIEEAMASIGDQTASIAHLVNTTYKSHEPKKVAAALARRGFRNHEINDQIF